MAHDRVESVPIGQHPLVTCLLNPLGADVKIKFLSTHAEAVLESPDFYKGLNHEDVGMFCRHQKWVLTLYITFPVMGTTQDISSKVAEERRSQE